MAQTLAWTTLNIAIFVTTNAEGLCARSAVAEIFALTCAESPGVQNARFMPQKNGMRFANLDVHRFNLSLQSGCSLSQKP